MQQFWVHWSHVCFCCPFFSIADYSASFSIEIQLSSTWKRQFYDMIRNWYNLGRSIRSVPAGKLGEWTEYASRNSVRIRWSFFFRFQRELISTRTKMAVWYGHRLSSSKSNNFPISSGRNWWLSLWSMPESHWNRPMKLLTREDATICQLSSVFS